MVNQNLENEGLFNDSGLASGGSVITRAPSFHVALGEFLYPQLIERERQLLFGTYSMCELLGISSPNGEESLMVLPNYWTARRIPTIESGALELWRVEITNEQVDWPLVQQVTTLRIYSDTGEIQHFRVVQVENAMKPGHVYLLRCEAIDQS